MESMSAPQADAGPSSTTKEGLGKGQTKEPVSSGDTSSAAQKATPPPKPKTPAKFILHGMRIFDALAVVFALNVIVIARFLRPGFWSTLMYTALGLPIGVGMSFLYFKRKKEKRTRRQLVRSTARDHSSTLTFASLNMVPMSVLLQLSSV